jgi:nitrile hydratase accessory protein
VTDPTLELEGAAALPRRNGEPVFGAPWQSRAFGIAMALHERGAFAWEDFRALLTEEIARATPEGQAEQVEDNDGSLYYSCWLAALSRVLQQRGVVDAGELARRAEEFRTGARREVH